MAQRLQGINFATADKPKALQTQHISDMAVLDRYRTNPADADARTAVWSIINPVVEHQVSSIGADADNYRVKAKLLAMDALKSFDPKSGASLKTHVSHHLSGLNRVRTERGFAVKIPEQQVYDREAIQREVAEYKDEHGFDPPDSELSSRLGISARRVQRARGFAETPESWMQSEKGEQMTGLSRKENTWQDFVYHDLDDKSKKIFEWSTGYNGTKSLPKHEIAKRLGISGAAVSQRISTIGSRLQEGWEQ